MERIPTLDTGGDRCVHRPEGSQGPGLQGRLGSGTPPGELQPTAHLLGWTPALPLRAQARCCKVFINLSAVAVPRTVICGAPLSALVGSEERRPEGRGI